MQTYYGLNRQGAAASGRYTRTPVPMGVPGIKSPFAAQALADPTAPALSDIAPQRRPGVPGGGDLPGISAPMPDDPATAKARGILRGYGVGAPGNPLSGLAKKGAFNTGVALAFDAPVPAALEFGARKMAALPGVATTVGSYLNKGIPYEGAVRDFGTKINEIDQQGLSENETLKAEIEAANNAYSQGLPYTTKFKRGVYDHFSPKKVIDPGAPPGAIGESGLGQPGSQPGDIGHEARMGVGVGDVAGTQEAADIPGTGDKPVGKDYGNRAEPGSAPGDEGGGVSGGGGYGPGVGGEGQSAGYK